ncbi:MAG: hypothetical protein Q8L15_21495 [Methylobacter sp.]|nr:hypothetical protein [Methylobacter sp.]
MKILVLLIALANVVLFMWEYRNGAFEQVVKTSQRPNREPIVLVSELKKEAVNVDFISLYPQGLDPLADNSLTEPFALKDFSATAPFVALGNRSMRCSTSPVLGVVPPASMQSTGELLFSAEPQNEAVIPTKP